MRLICKYGKHIVSARHTKGFGIHSPFLYNFTQHVIYDKNAYYIFKKIEQRRTFLANNSCYIMVRDFGTGKKVQRRINDIATKSAIRPQCGQVLFRLIQHLSLSKILELGTSFGISTAYIASNSNKNECITLEGCEQSAKIAQETFETLHLENVKILTGNINQTLVQAIEKLSSIDFVFIDANHTAVATIQYFEKLMPALSQNAVVVFDDIYWSKDMEYAWKTIKKHESVTATIDLFWMGIVFFKPTLQKINYKMHL
ncbi:MAG: hypothetical protein AUK44_08605 [Porphyromonadaceae bacterium CG2_30_38_12]|nr:MAG: hypothetical protein AUK44_08605 [Porphyromonadaceae bacterium CG2_30_38_12]